MNPQALHPRPRKHRLNQEGGGNDNGNGNGKGNGKGNGNPRILVACHPRTMSDKDHRYFPFIKQIVDKSFPDLDSDPIYQTTDITGSPDFIMDLYEEGYGDPNELVPFDIVFMLDCEMSVEEDWYTEEGISQVAIDLNNIFHRLVAPGGSLVLGKFTTLYMFGTEEQTDELRQFYDQLIKAGFSIEETEVNDNIPGHPSEQGPIWILSK